MTSAGLVVGFHPSPGESYMKPRPRGAMNFGVHSSAYLDLADSSTWGYDRAFDWDTPHMVGCQNHGPFLDPYCNMAPNM